MPDAPSFTRLFTLEEAQALLPRIAPLVERMTETFRKIRSEIEAAASVTGLDAHDPNLGPHLEARGIAPGLIADANDLIRRIHRHGCLVNGPEAGLVDFPAMIDAEIVFLCWQRGESGIAHWHRIPDGFAGRRPLLSSSGPEEPPSRIH